MTHVVNLTHTNFMYVYIVNRKQKGDVVAHSFNCTPRLSYMHLADAHETDQRSAKVVYAAVIGYFQLDPYTRNELEPFGLSLCSQRKTSPKSQNVKCDPCFMF